MTDNSRLSRKDLRGPDEFITAFNKAVFWLRANQMQVISAIGVVIVLVAAISGGRAYFAWQEAKATKDLWPHLNRAREILQTPGKVEDGKLAEIEQLLTAYVNLHPKSDASVYAHYYLGSIAFTRKNYDVSVAQFKSVLDLGKARGIMRFLPRQGLAQALEAKGDIAGASVAYRDAASVAPGDLRFQAKLGEARTLAMLGRGAEAITIYREIVASNPDSSTKEFAEIKLARLQ